MTSEPHSWPPGDGEMVRQLKTHDWAATSFGLSSGWSQRLRVMVEQVLANPLVATLVCGPDRLLIYNDAAARLFGSQHPAALGRPLPLIFPAGWETVAPLYERAFAGEVVTIAGQPLDTCGVGVPTEVFDALLTPVREADGHVAYVHMTGSDIAGRQRGEATLREGKQRLRLMLDHLAQASWETDGAGVVTIDSPSWRAYTGQSLEQWLGYGWLDAIHPDDRSARERQWHEAMAERRHINAEFRLRSPDGGWRWTNMRAVPSLDHKGNVHKWLGVNIDIDARKQAERRQAFMLRLSDAMHNATDGVQLEHSAVRVLADELGADRVFLATFAPDGQGWTIRHEDADKASNRLGYFAMSDFQRARLPQWRVGRMSSVADSETDPTLSASDRAAYTSFGARAAIGVPLARGGRFAALLCVNHAIPRIWTEPELSLTREAAERIWAAVERARAEEALREGEERLRGVLDSMAEGFALLDVEFVIRDVNRETLRLDGREREQLVGQSQWDAFPGARESEAGEMFQQVMRTRVPGSIEHLYVWPDGRSLWLEMRVYPTRDGGVAAFWRDVTERHDAGEALRRSEEKYRNLFESMDEAYAVVDVLRDAAGEWSDFRFVEVNPAFCKHTTMAYPVGKTATELLGSPNPRLAKLYGQALDADRPLRLEKETTLGRTFDLNICSLDRQQDRIAVLFTDITERQRATDALRESEARLAAAFDSVPVGIAVIDIAGRVVFSNTLYQRFLPTGKMSSLDPEGVGRWRAWTPEGRLLRPEEFPGSHALRGESVVPGQEMLFTDDAGREIWTSVAAVPMRDTDGQVTGLVSVIDDIDTKKRSLIALRETEVRLRQLFDSSPDYIIIMLDAEGRITRWNKGAEQALGHVQSDVLDQPVDLIFTPEDCAAGVPEKERQQAQATGRAEDERWHLRKDDTLVYFSGVVMPLDGSAEKGYIKIGRDLTQARRAEQQRDALLATEQSLRAQLQEANALKDELLAVVSHELKNPLNLISLNAQVLALRPDAQSGPLADIARVIEESVRSQGQLIDDLLDLSRVQTGKLSLNSQDVHCDELVERIVNAVQPDARVRRVALNLRVEPVSYLLRADPVRIEQIVWNLVSNALKFTPAGGVVDVGLAKTEGMLRLTVADTGEGIEAQHLPVIFEMFQQAGARATTRDKGGLGIGLNIVKRLVEAHGGAIEAASAGSGRGTTFTVTLPCQTVRSNLNPVQKSGRSLKQLQGTRILLVEDDHDALTMLGILLRSAGALVTLAASAQEALACAAPGLFDLIVSDIAMPDVDGYTLMARLREKGLPDVRAIALTGFARPDDRRRALAAGFDEHLGKPFQLDAFISAMERIEAARLT